ncbi:hypothetical protein AB1Y20_008540 [Prymnesium parvum]|uniref:RING-type domain-containing protein n=1 Tax=Prymnesium parvum TaxID=97485 RepID=A0AB34ITM9_PRYPA
MPRTRNAALDASIAALDREAVACRCFNVELCCDTSERRLRAHRRSHSGLTTRDLTCTICTEHGCIHTSGDSLLGCVIITSCGHPLHAVCAFEYVRHEYERRMLDHLPPLLDDLLGVQWANAWRTISCAEKAACMGLLFAPCPACRKEHAFAHFFAVCKHAPPSP